MIDVFIAFFSLLAVIFAALVLTLRQPMRCALALIGHMTSLAGVYAALGAHVIAMFQILIYVGAVMVFMVYTIMLLDDRDDSYRHPYSKAIVPAVAYSSGAIVTSPAGAESSILETPATWSFASNHDRGTSRPSWV